MPQCKILTQQNIAAILNSLLAMFIASKEYLQWEYLYKMVVFLGEF